MSKDKEKKNKSRKHLGTFIAGAAIGAGLGVLFAPKKGSETRAELKSKCDELAMKAKGLKASDVKKYIDEKIEEIKEALADLDKEKVLKYAKEKAKEINKKTEELMQYVVEKGTPVMKQTAAAIKEKASIVTKDVINKLEKQQKAKKGQNKEEQEEA